MRPRSTLICKSRWAQSGGAARVGTALGVLGSSGCPHLVEDHLPVLWVSGGQENLLALLIDLVDARSQVCRESVERTAG